MKRLTQIFQALLGVVALIFTALVAVGRLAWRTIRNCWKGRPKWLRRSVKIVLVSILVGLVALVAYAYYDGNYGKSYWGGMNLSDSIETHHFRDGKYRVYDRRIGDYTTPKLNWVSEASEGDSLAVYALPHKRGYINVNTGCIEIAAEANDYSKAWVFSEGLAAVMKGDKIGFINAHNEVVIPFQFDYSDKCRMVDFGYVFHNGYCAMTDVEGRLGLVDRGGNWVVEPSYDEIWAPHTSGYRVVVKDGKHGVLDADCAVVYPAEYGHIGVVSDGFVLTKGGRQWQVNFEGNVVQPFMFEDTYDLYYPIGYNESGEMQYTLADYVKYEIVNSYGILNRITGEPITPAIYSDINMLSSELFEVQEYDRYSWYLLDANGRVISKK